MATSIQVDEHTYVPSQRANEGRYYLHYLTIFMCPDRASFPANPHSHTRSFHCKATLTNRQNNSRALDLAMQTLSEEITTSQKEREKFYLVSITPLRPHSNPYLFYQQGYCAHIAIPAHEFSFQPTALSTAAATVQAQPTMAT